MDGCTGDKWDCGGFSHSVVNCEGERAAASPVKIPHAIMDHTVDSHGEIAEVNSETFSNVDFNCRR